MIKESQHKTDVIYFNTEGGKIGKSINQLVVPSANLVDFLLDVISLSDNGAILFPRMNMDKEVFLETPPNCSQIEFPHKYNGSVFERIILIFQYPIFLLNSKNRTRLKNASHTVSMGYDFFGSVAAIVRVYILKQTHTYIIRGNRPKTVATSSRSFSNKKFTLFRLAIYELIMKRMLTKGQADIWFQGQEKYEEYMKITPVHAQKRLHLLNAVLRNLPASINNTKNTDLVFLGHINIEKGIIDLITALKVLKKYEITLRVVGSGPDENLVKKLIKDYGLSKYVKLAGFASSDEAVAQELASAKLFILPSHTEGLPRSMVESMAIGTPVLVTPVGGIPYVIEDYKNGFLTETKNPTTLARNIKTILDKIENNEIDNIIKKAKEDANNFSFKNRAKAFLETSVGNQID